jgi:hypothetical protein
MRASRLLGLFGLTIVLLGPAARAQMQSQPLRVGNTNLLLLGGGFSSFNHPNNDSGTFPNLAYQHRILRYESRVVHLWLRGAVNFSSFNNNIAHGYTVWREDDDSPFPERVHEHTSDVTFRGEMLADVLHTSRSALYTGFGFALHYLTFDSDGQTSGIPVFTANDNQVSPSYVAGARLFAAKRPYTAYGEVRYGRAYGKTTAVKDSTHPWLTDQIFAFTSVHAISVEGGVGMHW